MNRQKKRFKLVHLKKYAKYYLQSILNDETKLGNNMKCLIVDDECTGVELLKCYLHEHAKTIDTANNGVEAVSLFATALEKGEPYRLVCLDILMPVMNGQEALKQMRSLEQEFNQKAPAVIIMTTALNSVQEIQEAILQGDCNNYLIKPISKIDLVKILKRYNLIS